MPHDTLEAARYPIGRFNYASGDTAAARPRWIAALAALPDEMEAAVEGLSYAARNSAEAHGIVTTTLLGAEYGEIVDWDGNLWPFYRETVKRIATLDAVTFAFLAPTGGRSR